MNTEERKCPKCKHQHEAVLYQETDGSFVCGHLLSDAVIERYKGFREALALSLERAERMTATGDRRGQRRTKEQ
jgi:hypothetical protein